MSKILVLTAIILRTTFFTFAGGTSDHLFVAFPTDPKKEKAFEDAAAEYMNLNEDVTIELISIPAWEYERTVLYMLDNGIPLDVIHVNTPLYIRISDRLLELTHNMMKSGYLDPNDGLYSAWFNLLASDGYFDDVSKLFQAPLRTGTTVLAYNKRMFDQAGLDYPTEEWTWNDDFLDAAKRLTRNSRTANTNGG